MHRATMRDLMTRNDDAAAEYWDRFTPGLDPEADENRAIAYNADR